MSKKMIVFYLTAIGSGYLLGAFLGILYAYYNPMHQLNGYWKNNYFFSTQNDQYHINSRVSITGRAIKFSSEVYDQAAVMKFNRDLTLSLVDTKNNIFKEEVTSSTTANMEDEVLNLLFNNPLVISRPTFYLLDNKTILFEQSQGNTHSSARLLKRSDRNYNN